MFITLLFTVASNGFLVLSPVAGGVNTTTGERPARQDITTMDPLQRDLFILALEDLQGRNQTEENSWFQFAGQSA
jgi:hypothetical protein